MTDHDRLSKRILDGPLALVLGLVALVQVATWLPHYLTWPYWADLDVFANAARAWDQGLRPYRDVRQNNFPGTTYQFYLLGKLFGWGKTWPIHAVDGSIVVSLVVVLAIWSRRIFGAIWPGLIGSLAVLSVILSLDYAHAVQRDGQGPALAIIALLVVQTWPGRAGRFASAVVAALAVTIRPQTILFLPAIVVAVSMGDESRSRSISRAGVWLATFVILVGLAFLPIVKDGLIGDFVASLRRVAFGSTYNRVSLASVAKGWVIQACAFRWLVVPAAILLVGRQASPGERSVARAWLVALAGASMYKPLSPMPHSYLDIPLALTWAVNLAGLAGLIGLNPMAPATIKLAASLGLLGMGTTTLRPDFCVVGPTLRAVQTLRSGVEPVEAPPGYRKGTVATSAFYPWEDYRAVLAYLRGQTRPRTRVGNALKGDPAIVSVVDRPSAFPAESIAWLRMVNRDDEGAFAAGLERPGDAVVLWSPGEVGPDPTFRIDQIESVIRQFYEFEARFGSIEIWRRRAEPSSMPVNPSPN